MYPVQPSIRLRCPLPSLSTIIYVLIAAYLITGLFLARSVLRVPRKRMRLRDLALGAVVMPVLSTFLFLCIVFEAWWKRLLIALDYDPPEEMRAGPDLPGKKDSVE